MVTLKLKEQIIDKGLNCIVIAHGQIYAGTNPKGDHRALVIQNPHLVKKNILVEMLDTAYITAPYTLAEIDNSG